MDQASDVGQDATIRRRVREALSHARQRFSRAVSNISFNAVDMTDHVEDSPGENVIIQGHPQSVLVLDRTTPEVFFATVNTLPEVSSIALAFNNNITDFDGIVADVSNLEGLFLYCVSNITDTGLVNFLRRTPRLKSLTLCGGYVSSKALSDIFNEGLLSNITHFETDDFCDDDVIETLANAPRLASVFFADSNGKQTNNGFFRLVEKGGGKHLKAITAGAYKSYPSSTLTTRYLSILLPGVVLVNMEGGRPDDVPPPLTHNDHVPTSTTQISLQLTTAQIALREQEQRRLDSLPGAIVPLERMTLEQMIVCLAERRIYYSPNYSIDDMQELLRENGYTLASEYVRKLTAEKARLADMPDVDDLTIEELQQELLNRNVPPACYSSMNINSDGSVNIEQLQDLLLSTGYPGPEMKFFVSQVDLNFGVSLSPNEQQDITTTQQQQQQDQQQQQHDQQQLQPQDREANNCSSSSSSSTSLKRPAEEAVSDDGPIDFDGLDEIGGGVEVGGGRGVGREEREEEKEHQQKRVKVDT